MAGLGSFTEASFFHLNKVTHMGLLRDVAARAQVREWANRCVAVNDGIGNNTMVTQGDAISDDDIFKNAAGTHEAVRSNAGGTEELNARLNDRALADDNLRGKDALFGTK